MKVTQKLSTKIFLMVNGTIILTLAIVLSISIYSFICGIQTDVERQLTALTKEKAQRFEDALTHQKRACATGACCMRFASAQAITRGGMSYVLSQCMSKTIPETLLRNRGHHPHVVNQFSGIRQLVPVHFVHDIKNIVIGRKGTRFESLADLHGKVVAQTRGTSFDEAFNQDQAIEKYYVVDSAQGFTMLMHDRVDAYIGPEFPTVYSVQQLGYTRDDLGDPLVLNTRPIWAHVSAATVDADTIAALNDAIEILLAEGKIQQLIEKYLGK